MATLTVTYPAGDNTGSSLRALAAAIEKMAAGVPDVVPTGASTVLTIDNAPATGRVSVALTAGPYQASAVITG